MVPSPRLRVNLAGLSLLGHFWGPSGLNVMNHKYESYAPESMRSLGEQIPATLIFSKYSNSVKVFLVLTFSIYMKYV